MRLRTASASSIILSVIIAALVITGCGERKNPNGTQLGYTITSVIPPIGVPLHLALNPGLGTGFLSTEYGGLYEVDLSNPGNPSLGDKIENGFLGPVLSSYYSELTNMIYIETMDNGAWPKLIRMFDYDSVQTAVTCPFYTASPPVKKFIPQEFTSLNSGEVVLDSIYLDICDLSETLTFQRQYIYPVGGNLFLVFYSTGYQTNDVYDFAVNGQYAYLAVDKYGMVIVDMNNNCSLVGSYDTEGYSRAIAYQDGYCYLADRHWGLQIIDVTDPANPVRTANLLFAGADDCEKVKVDGNRAVVMDAYDGVFVVDVADPANPQLMFSFDTITPTDVYISGDYIYVIDEDAGVVTARIE